MPWNRRDGRAAWAGSAPFGCQHEAAGLSLGGDDGTQGTGYAILGRLPQRKRCSGYPQVRKRAQPRSGSFGPAGVRARLTRRLEMNCVKWLITAGAVMVPAILLADEALEKAAQDPNQWVLPLGSYSGIRHSTLTQINPRNAGKLRVAWTMSTGTLRGQEGQPLVVGNMMYFESSYPNFVYAIDLDKVGQIVWKFSPEQDKFSPSVACCDLVNKGVSYADGKIIVTTLDTMVYALDAKTGKVVWSAKNGDPQLGQTMTMAPLIVHDKVIVGISGGEYGVRGYLSAFDLKSGKLVWRANSVGPDADILFDPVKTIDGATQQPVGKDSSLKTWHEEEWKLGGGTTWGWYTYDPQLNLVYYGSGNPGTWNPGQRPGEYRWSTTLFARNPDTGVRSEEHTSELQSPV